VFGQLIRLTLPQIQFVYLGPCVCLRLPSDPASRQAPLPLANGRRSPAPIPDFHRRDDAHAGRTKNGLRHSRSPDDCLLDRERFSSPARGCRKARSNFPSPAGSPGKDSARCSSGSRAVSTAHAWGCSSSCRTARIATARASAGASADCPAGGIPTGAPGCCPSSRHCSGGPASRGGCPAYGCGRHIPGIGPRSAGGAPLRAGSPGHARRSAGCISPSSTDRLSDEARWKRGLPPRAHDSFAPGVGDRVGACLRPLAGVSIPHRDDQTPKMPRCYNVN